ncbi:MAG: alpha/beta fold hydrolase [Persicimonas sp.]
MSKDDVEIPYRVLGEGDRDLLLVHGWMVSGAVFDDLIEELDQTRWRIVVPDLRGASEASRTAPGYELTDYVADVHAVVEDAGLDSAVVVGHSMGGQIAQLFAAEHPEHVERLVLLCPVPVAGMELPPEADQLFKNSGQDREAQASILQMACLDLEEAARNRLLDDAGKIPSDCIRGSYLAWTSGGPTARLADIEAPTLVVGSDDPFLPPDFLNQAVVEPIAKARFERVEGAGHYVQIERAAETAALLETFGTGGKG